MKKTPSLVTKFFLGLILASAGVFSISDLVLANSFVLSPAVTDEFCFQTNNVKINFPTPGGWDDYTSDAIFNFPPPNATNGTSPFWYDSWDATTSPTGVNETDSFGIVMGISGGTDCGGVDPYGTWTFAQIPYNIVNGEESNPCKDNGDYDSCEPYFQNTWTFDVTDGSASSTPEASSTDPALMTAEILSHALFWFGMAVVGGFLIISHFT